MERNLPNSTGYIVLTCPKAGAFLEKAGAWLEQHEVENNLILGVCRRMLASPERVKIQPFLGVVEQAGQIELAAMITPPHNLVLAGLPASETEDLAPSQLDESALQALAEHLITAGWDPPGVLGTGTTSPAFARIWAELSEKKADPGMKMRLFELTEVTSPQDVPGKLRPAGRDDLERVVDWVIRFQEEALHESTEQEKARELVEQRIGAGEIFIWDHDGPVSLAAKGRPTGNVISIGLVYTPPELRRRGYAGACVAALSQRLLEEGFPIISLYTDLANPTSNHIYTEVGFRPVCDFEEYKFRQV